MAQKKSWQERKMQTLVRGLYFKTTDEYYNYIEVSKINGNNKQVRELFRDMPKENRKEFLSYLADEVKRGETGYPY